MTRKKNNITFPLGLPEKPEDLKGEASEFWDLVVPKLFELGVVTPLDRFALHALCLMYERAMRLQNDALNKPATFEAENGSIRAHPAQTVANQAAEQFRKGLSDFGLNSAARGRLGFSVSEVKSEDDDETFFA